MNSQWIPSGYSVLDSNSDRIILERRTGFRINDNNVTQEIKICKDGTWDMKIGGTTLYPKDLDLSEHINFTETAFKSLLQTLTKIIICQGKPYQCVDSSKILTEQWSYNEGATEVRIRHVECQRVAKLLSTKNSCDVCNKRIWDITHYRKKPLQSTENIQLNNNVSLQQDKLEYSEILKCIPDAPEEFKTLLNSQVNYLQCTDKRSNRWPQEIIELCLSLWTRSPRSYEDLSKSGFLKLPSCRLLHYYKSCVQQSTGFNKDVLKWMHAEAERHHIQDKEGGILIDEMAIQEDLQISNRGGHFSLVGFIDMGEEANNIQILIKGEKHMKLASHVLQVTFLGYSGFRFPVACFASSTANAAELYTIFWDTVHHLQLYNFIVHYCCMDGACANRTFMKMHVISEPNTYKVKNMYGTGEIVFLQDYSHVIKKVRNSLCKSSLAPKSARCLQKGDKYILWEYWVSAYNWDLNCNPFPIHRKLTDEHIYLSTQSKMRNHLAEEVLDKDMLHLMMKYQNSLAKGDHLDSSIEMLQHTSLLVLCFRDMRPIMTINDDRLKDNKKVLTWFQEWEKEVSNMTVKAKEKKLISAQCREDIASLIIGFEEICQIRLAKVDATLVPARINSDPIENFFCQQRAKHHGSNDNPSYHAYLTGINSIILGQATVSNKANARKSAAQPYHFQSAGPLVPRKMPRL